MNSVYDKSNRYAPSAKEAKKDYKQKYINKVKNMCSNINQSSVLSDKEKIDLKKILAKNIINSI